MLILVAFLQSLLMTKALKRPQTLPSKMRRENLSKRMIRLNTNYLKKIPSQLMTNVKSVIKYFNKKKSIY